MEYENIVIHLHTENEYAAAEMEITNRQSYCVSDDDCEVITYCREYICDCKDGDCNPVRKKPVNGGFSSWSTWSSCESGARTQERDRKCNNPPPKDGGLPCVGRSHEEQACTSKDIKLLSQLKSTSTRLKFLPSEVATIIFFCYWLGMPQAIYYLVENYEYSINGKGRVK